MTERNQISRSFWAVVAVGFIVLACLGWIIQSNASSTAKRLCLVEQGILKRQQSGTQQSRDTDVFFRDNSVSPIFRAHFGALVPVQDGRLVEIQAELDVLGEC